MPRSRVEIQKDIIIYKAGVKANEIILNKPIWDNKYDPNYLSIKDARDENVLKLDKLEKELAKAKARGDKGRSLAEIRKEISETESTANDFRTYQNRAVNILEQSFHDQNAILMECTVDVLQEELDEAIEEEEIIEIQKRYKQKISRKPNDANNYKLRGKDYFLKGYYNLAIDDYTKIIKDIDSKDIEAYQELGIIYSKIQNYDQAIENFTNALALEPSDAEIYVLRGVAYSKMSEYNKAMEDFDKAIQLNPKCKNAYKAKGNINCEKGEYDKSIENYKDALLFDPKDSVFINLMENAKRLKEEAELKQKVERKKEKIKKFRKVGRGISILFAVLATIMIFVINSADPTGIITLLILIFINLIPFLVIFFTDKDSIVTKGILLCIGILISIFVLWVYIIAEGGDNQRAVMGSVGLGICNLLSCITAFISPREKKQGV